MEEVRYHRQKEEEYENLIKELKHDVKEIKDELNETKSGRGNTKTSNVKNLKHLCSMFLKGPEYQWRNAISMQYTDYVTPGW